MKFRQPLKITSRTSSVTNAFVQSIIPSIKPSNAEISEALHILGMSADDYRCVYCGAPATEWDHLRPLVEKKRPTGFINEIRNAVPSCGPCNQSKNGADWRQWIDGGAPGSPRSKGIADIEQRRERLVAYETWAALSRVAFEECVPKDLWDAHWENLERIHAAMQLAQCHAERLRDAIAEFLNAKSEMTSAPDSASSTSERIAVPQHRSLPPPSGPNPGHRSTSRHRWREDDDLVGYYLFRHGANDLPLTQPEIAELLGMPESSLIMKQGNYRSLAGGNGLSSASAQSRRIFERHKKTSHADLRQLVLEVLDQGAR